MDISDAVRIQLVSFLISFKFISSILSNGRSCNATGEENSALLRGGLAEKSKGGEVELRSMGLENGSHEEGATRFCLFYDI